MKKLMIVAAALSVMILTTSVVLAQEVVFTGEKAPLPVYQTIPTDESAEPEEVSVDHVAVLGIADDYVVVAIDKEAESSAESTEQSAEQSAEETAEQPEEQTAETSTASTASTTTIAYVPLEAIQEIIPSIDYASLPAVTGWTDQGQGARGEYVADAQTALISLGILSGSADGVFGSMTGNAIAAFQTENNLSVTGTLDLLTYFAIVGGESEPLTVSYPPVYTVDDKFANILADVADADVLEAFVTPSFRYTFDAFEGEGLITTGTILGTYEDTSRPIDTISITAFPAMKVKREDNGVISVKPVIRVESIGAYRPYTKKLILKAGNTVKEFDVTDISGELLGTEVAEAADLEVDVKELKELLDKGDLEVRLKGNSREYDLNVSAGIEDLLTTLGQ